MLISYTKIYMYIYLFMNLPKLINVDVPMHVKICKCTIQYACKSSQFFDVVKFMLAYSINSKYKKHLQTYFNNKLSILFWCLVGGNQTLHQNTQSWHHVPGWLVKIVLYTLRALWPKQMLFSLRYFNFCYFHRVPYTTRQDTAQNIWVLHGCSLGGHSTFTVCAARVSRSRV